MRPPRIRIVLLVAALGALGVGCSRGEKPEASKEFCRAADRYNTELERQQEDGEIDTDRQIERVEQLAATAPAAIKDDAEVFLDALQRVDDDPAIKDDPKIRNAVDDVNRYANQACGVYDRDSGI